MSIKRLLIANRSEIAIRVARAARSLGIETVSIYSKDDETALHRKFSDLSIEIAGNGPAAYLDYNNIVDVAKQAQCDAVHPGYGLLSENADFAHACEKEGIIFVGPHSGLLRLLGDKAAARELAQKNHIPIIKGTEQATTVDGAHAFFDSLEPGQGMMIKALSGGGGRGMRAVYERDKIADTYKVCQSEASSAFGVSDLYVEQLVDSPRHIEVQIIGDGSGTVVAFGDRDCSLQRNFQKLIELAPSPNLSDSVRNSLHQAAKDLALAMNFKGAVTIEFLVETSQDNSDPRFYFVEANPRIQVEHTVTEEVHGIDLVVLQLEVAGGKTLPELGWSDDNVPAPTGFAVQLRVNAETIDATGAVRPSSGTLSHFSAPSGPGVRLDTGVYGGYTLNPRFDSLLAKLIVHSRSTELRDVLSKAYNALCEFHVEGVKTNIPLLKNILTHDVYQQGCISTAFLGTYLKDLISVDRNQHLELFADVPASAIESGSSQEVISFEQVDSAITAPLNGTIVEIHVEVGQSIVSGEDVAIIEAMKMHHVIQTQYGGIVQSLPVALGETVLENQPIIVLEDITHDDVADSHEEKIDLEKIRPDLQEVYDRQARTLDAARPKAVERRHGLGKRTPRENIEHLIDEGSFIEYGSLLLAAQRKRREFEDLIDLSPADGVITGLASVNGEFFSKKKSQCMVVSYDSTVFAGTQGLMGHKKKDRMFDLALELEVPLVLFAEGGGGRPGDTDIEFMVETPSFIRFARLSGVVPLVGVTSRYCFAGNAALLGCCDVIIATKDSCIGMSGPAMIEGGGLGRFRPDEIGPVSLHSKTGVVDVVVEDESEAVEVAKKYLSYFQGPLNDWDCDDQRILRHTIPENRLRAYDIRSLIKTMADKASVLELKKDFGVGVVTSFVRIEGNPVGIVANNSSHLGGAIDRDAAFKATEFMRLCNAFGLPVLCLCDTPGFMIGPEAEKTAQVRVFSDMFIASAQLKVPIFSVVLRKGYGLGALAMCAGSFQAPIFTVSWPTGEFGPMGLEGAVKLSHKNELEAIEDPAERLKLFETLVEAEYEKGKGLNAASHYEIDNVIDPQETRKWILRGLEVSRLSEGRFEDD